jgi:hypothetical protein
MYGLNTGTSTSSTLWQEFPCMLVLCLTLSQVFHTSCLQLPYSSWLESQCWGLVINCKLLRSCLTMHTSPHHLWNLVDSQWNVRTYYSILSILSPIHLLFRSDFCLLVLLMVGERKQTRRGWQAHSTISSFMCVFNCVVFNRAQDNCKKDCRFH